MEKVIKRKSILAKAEKPRVKGVSKNSAEARSKILDSAILIFGKQGFARTTTEQIAEYAGYGQATVFFHFKTKSGLLEACLEETLERAKKNLVLAENSGTVDLMRRLDQAFDNDPTADFFDRMLIEFGEDHAIQPIYAAHHAVVRDLIAAELLRETAADQSRIDLAAGALLAMMIGVHAEQRLEKERIRHSDFREMLLSVTRLVVNDLTRPGGPVSQPTDIIAINY